MVEIREVGGLHHHYECPSRYDADRLHAAAPPTSTQEMRGGGHCSSRVPPLKELIDTSRRRFGERFRFLVGTNWRRSSGSANEQFGA